MRKLCVLSVPSAAIALGVGFLALSSQPANACPTEPYLGSICATANNKCPSSDYMLAQGQVLQITTNQALFALLGNTFGGDARTTFGLPDLRGRAPVGLGTGQSASGAPLTTVTRGKIYGTQTTALTTDNLPPHTHTATFTPSPTGGLQATASITAAGGASGTASIPAAGTPYLAGNPQGTTMWAASAPTPVTVQGFTAQAPGTLSGSVTNDPTGANAPIQILPPQLGLNYCIAVKGIWPPRP